MTAWRPDWSAIGPKKHSVKPTAAERRTRVVQSVVGPVAGNGTDQLVALQFTGNDQDPTVQKAFKQFRSHEAATFTAAGLTVGFTGGIASMTDQVDHQAKTQALQGLLLYAAIVLLSFVFFRGLLSSIVPLLTVGIVATGAGGLVVLAASALRLQDRLVAAVAGHHGADRNRSRLLPVHDVPLPRAAARRG